MEPSPAAAPSPVSTSTDLERFEGSVHHVLSQTGLPIAQLFVPVTERKTLIAALPGVLDKLEPKVLNRSFYVYKMIAAATVGLFDAALNYLWDELVSELRRRVAGFDLVAYPFHCQGDKILRPGEGHASRCSATRSPP